LAVLYGNIAPTGAVIKPTAASPDLMVHKGKAIVFEDHDDLGNRIDDPDLEVSPDDILVMKNSGPIGGPGIPEWGFLPIPKKILATGVRDMVRLSDARMSGTAFGTVVVHVTPESAGGGPLSAIRDGDMIELDVPNRKLNLLVTDEELAERLNAHKNRAPDFKRGYKWLHAQHILQADKGCDFDFLRAESLQSD
jgi:dihydroxy-acid dehydratase